MLDELLVNCRTGSATVREGYLSLFVFLPKAFGDAFGEHVDKVFPVVLLGVNDDTEPVRDVAMRACQVLVFMFSRTHTDLLLPELEGALSDSHWRIRDCGCRLLGDFLHRLAGAKSAINYDQEDEAMEIGGVDPAASAASTAASNDIRAAIELALGRAAHDRILSTLYLARADVINFVRTSAWRVWKSIVSATPRLVRELLPTLMDLIIDSLASENSDRQAAASATLGELVSKMGDAVLPVVVPILQTGLSAHSAHARQGVGLGLSEVLRSAHKAHIGAYMAVIIPTILRAICDIDSEVREAAAVAFATLLRNTGQRAIDDTVPELVKQLFAQGLEGKVQFDDEDEDEEDAEDDDDNDGSDSDDAASAPDEKEAGEAEDDDDEDDEDDDDDDEDEDDEDDDDEDGSEFEERDDNVYDEQPHVLEGLRTILDVAPEKILPLLLPPLLTPSVTVFSLRVLANLATSFGDEVHSYLPEILRSVVRAIAADTTNAEDAAKMLVSAQTFVLDAVSQSNVHQVVTTMVELVDGAGPRGLHHNGRQATVCAQLLGALCSGSDHDLDEYVPMMFQTLLPLLNAYHEGTQDAALDALEALVASISKDDLSFHVAAVHKAIHNLVVDQTGEVYLTAMPAFSRPKGLMPLWPLFQHGLLYGTPEVRTVAAKSVGELIQLTPADALKPVVVSKLAGPLIRIVGDRFPPPVKTAILHTLTILIGKAGKHLKQFLPPLQTAFVKTLYDPAPPVRAAGAIALGRLMPLQPKIEPLVNEVLLSIKLKAETDMRASLFDAMRGILREAFSAAAAAAPSGVGVPALSAAAITSLRDATLEFATAPEDAVRSAACRALGVVGRLLTDSDFAELLVGFVLDLPDVPRLRVSRAEALAALLLQDPTRCLQYAPSIHGACQALLADSESAMARVGGAAAVYLWLRALLRVNHASLATDGVALLTQLVGLCPDDVIDVRIAALERMAALGKFVPLWMRAHTALCVPAIFVRLADSTLPVQHAAKHALYYCLQVTTTKKHDKNTLRWRVCM